MSSSPGAGNSPANYRITFPMGQFAGSTPKLSSHGTRKVLRFGRTGGMVDVTERKQAQRALVEAEKRAATGEMAAILAHEINNPLAAITNLVYLLKQDGIASPASRQYVELADQETRRVSQLVQRTLSFYRDDSQPVRFSAREILKQLVSLYRPRFEQSRVKLELRAQDGGEIVCKPGEVNQIFSNLLGNAMEAAAPGGKVIVHAARWRQGAGRPALGVRIVFADNGTGIAQEHRSRLFQPFFTTKGERGTGLGLWISKGLAEKNGGSIRIRTRTGSPSGTCVAVYPSRPGSRASGSWPEVGPTAAFRIDKAAHPSAFVRGY